MKASFKKIPSRHEILLGTDFEGNRSVECPWNYGIYSKMVMAS